METYTAELAPRFTRLLSRRDADLRQLLNAASAAYGDDGAHEVTDFKDLAAGEARAAVDSAQADHAALELGEVLAAQRRLCDNSYGQCVNCGEAIELRRLVVLPATPYCAACAEIYEHERSAA